MRVWQAPNDYSELRSFLSRCDVDFDEILGKYSKLLRDGKRHYLLMGFPAPDVVGEEATHLTWVACLLPVLSERKDLGVASKGKESTLRVVDKHKIFRGSADIEWTNIVNVAEKQLHSRGSLCNELVNSNVLVVGAGSLGSMVCEGLARGGVTRFSISDNDLFMAGNVTRHTLGFFSSMKSKASELCERLKNISPNIKASALDALGLSGGPVLEEYDLVVICTGFSVALNHLGISKKKANARLAIFSFDMGAKNVFCWLGKADLFNRSDYEEAIMPYAEEAQCGDLEMPWEGTGCWSPVFPASYSDVAAAAAVCLRSLDAYMTNASEQPQMWLFRQEYDESGFPVGMKGVRL